MQNVSRRLVGPALFVAGVALGTVVNATALAAPQPYMQGALQNLNAAYTNLQNASADKGGYRAKAMDDIQDAIRNVRLGIRWANRH
jgi:hypothetical protein